MGKINTGDDTRNKHGVTRRQFLRTLTAGAVYPVVTLSISDCGGKSESAKQTKGTITADTAPTANKRAKALSTTPPTVERPPSTHYEATERDDVIILKAPAYEVHIERSPFRITTLRAGQIALETISGNNEKDAALQFDVNGATHSVRNVESSHWDGNVLGLRLSTDSPDYEVMCRIFPMPDRYEVGWRLGNGAKTVRMGMVYDLSSAGHWYGHGEVSLDMQQPWPLDSGEVYQTSGPGRAFSPFSRRGPLDRYREGYGRIAQS